MDQGPKQQKEEWADHPKIAEILHAASEWSVDQDFLDKNLNQIKSTVNQPIGRKASNWSWTIRRRIRMLVVFGILLISVLAVSAVIKWSPIFRSDPKPIQKKSPPNANAPAEDPAKQKIKRVTQVNPQNTNRLSDQLALYQQAKRLMTEKKYLHALAKLDEFQARFPRSPLAPEVLISRVELLVASDQRENAAKLILQLIEKKSLSGKRAQLYLLLGDIRLRQKRCPEARNAYRRALGLGLSEDRASSARNGMKECWQ